MKPSIGLGVVPGEQSFFHENERNDQERSHRSETERTIFKKVGTCPALAHRGSRMRYKGNFVDINFFLVRKIIFMVSFIFSLPEQSIRC